MSRSCIDNTDNICDNMIYLNYSRATILLIMPLLRYRKRVPFCDALPTILANSELGDVLHGVLKYVHLFISFNIQINMISQFQFAMQENIDINAYVSKSTLRILYLVFCQRTPVGVIYFCTHEMTRPSQRGERQKERGRMSMEYYYRGKRTFKTCKLYLYVCILELHYICKKLNYFCMSPESYFQIY